MQKFIDGIKTLGKQAKSFDVFETDNNGTKSSFGESSRIFCKINKSLSYLKSFFKFTASKNDHQFSICGADKNSAKKSRELKLDREVAEQKVKTDPVYEQLDPPNYSFLNESKTFSHPKINLLENKISEKFQKSCNNDQLLKLWSDSINKLDKQPQSREVNNNMFKLFSALLSCNPSLQNSLEKLVQEHGKTRSKKHNRHKRSISSSTCKKTADHSCSYETILSALKQKEKNTTSRRKNKIKQSISKKCSCEKNHSEEEYLHRMKNIYTDKFKIGNVNSDVFFDEINSTLQPSQSQTRNVTGIKKENIDIPTIQRKNRENLKHFKTTNDSKSNKCCKCNGFFKADKTEENKLDINYKIRNLINQDSVSLEFLKTQDISNSEENKSLTKNLEILSLLNILLKENQIEPGRNKISKNMSTSSIQKRRKKTTNIDNDKQKDVEENNINTPLDLKNSVKKMEEKKEVQKVDKKREKVGEKNYTSKPPNLPNSEKNIKEKNEVQKEVDKKRENVVEKNASVDKNRLKFKVHFDETVKVKLFYKQDYEDDLSDDYSEEGEDEEEEDYEYASEEEAAKKDDMMQELESYLEKLPGPKEESEKEEVAPESPIQKLKNKYLLSYFGRGAKSQISGKNQKKLTELLSTQEHEIDAKSIKKSRERKREGDDISKLKGDDENENDKNDSVNSTTLKGEVSDGVDNSQSGKEEKIEENKPAKKNEEVVNSKSSSEQKFPENIRQDKDNVKIDIKVNETSISDVTTPTSENDLKKASKKKKETKENKSKKKEKKVNSENKSNKSRDIKKSKKKKNKNKSKSKHSNDKKIAKENSDDEVTVTSKIFPSSKPKRNFFLVETFPVDQNKVVKNNTLNKKVPSRFEESYSDMNNKIYFTASTEKLNVKQKVTALESKIKKNDYPGPKNKISIKVNSKNKNKKSNLGIVRNDLRNECLQKSLPESRKNLTIRMLPKESKTDELKLLDNKNKSSLFKKHSSILYMDHNQALKQNKVETLKVKSKNSHQSSSNVRYESDSTSISKKSLNQSKLCAEEICNDFHSDLKSWHKNLVSSQSCFSTRGSDYENLVLNSNYSLSNSSNSDCLIRLPSECSNLNCNLHSSVNSTGSLNKTGKSVSFCGVTSDNKLNEKRKLEFKSLKSETSFASQNFSCACGLVGESLSKFQTTSSEEESLDKLHKNKPNCESCTGKTSSFNNFCDQTTRKLELLEQKIERIDNLTKKKEKEPRLSSDSKVDRFNVNSAEQSDSFSGSIKSSNLQLSASDRLVTLWTSHQPTETDILSEKYSGDLSSNSSDRNSDFSSVEVDNCSEENETCQQSPLFKQGLFEVSKRSPKLDFGLKRLPNNISLSKKNACKNISKKISKKSHKNESENSRKYFKKQTSKKQHKTKQTTKFNSDVHKSSMVEWFLNFFEFPD